MTNRKRERLTELLGVLLYLIECSEDEAERDFFDKIANKTEQKIRRYKV